MVCSVLVNCNFERCCVTTTCHPTSSFVISVFQLWPKTSQRRMYILQNTTPNLYIACKLQVPLSDTDHIMSPALSSSVFPSFSEASQWRMYILLKTTPNLCIAHKLQVLLSDTDHIMAPALSSSAIPSLSEASQRQMPAGTSSSSNGPEQQHPLRPYWEYLSFLFKRQPEPDPDQMLELSYRDYLQVLPMQSCRGK